MDYETRLAQAKALSARPLKKDLPTQKFKRGQMIKVCDEMPPHKRYFESGFYGIIEYTYAQKYGGDNIDSYSLIVLEKGKPVNSIAWYNENQLTLIDSDTGKGLKIIESYNFD